MSGSSLQERPRDGRETLVFLHGSGDSARTWDALVPLLGDFECVAFDLPGHGAQVERPGPAEMDVADYADYVRAALAYEHLDEVCLVGHSLGSAIALRLAVDYPSLARRLVLIGAGARMRVLPDLLEQARSEPQEAMRRLVSMGTAPRSADLAEEYMASLPPTAPDMLARDLAACNGFDMMGELGRVSQPALVLVGDMDRLAPPKYATYLADHLARAQLVTIADAGHFLQIEHPEAVADAMRAWLEQSATSAD